VAFLHFCRCPVQPGVDGASLGGSVLVVRSGELGAVDRQLGGDDDPAAMKSGLNQVTLGDAGEGAQAGGQRHLASQADSRAPRRPHPIELHFIDRVWGDGTMIQNSEMNNSFGCRNMR